MRIRPTLWAPFLCFATPVAAFAQNVTVDWIGRNVVSSPAKINQKANAQIQVINVNDILYTYSTQLTATPNDHTDADQVLKVLSGETHLAAVCYQDALDAAQAVSDKLPDFFALPERNTLKGYSSCSAKTPCSITLKDTRDEWDKTLGPLLLTASGKLKQAQADSACIASSATKINAIQKSVESYIAIDGSVHSDNHVSSTQVVLEPDTAYSIDVKELYKGVQTTQKTLTVTFSPGNDRLTLSAGVLFSQVQNRGYTSQSVPATSGTGTMNVLAVSGQSAYSPYLLGLLNYEIPSIGGKKRISFGNDSYGLAVSTGPVVRIGSKSDTSSFGYFIGLGLHLYHRLYITPGANFGEFADYPLGFTTPGQTVPSGTATLTPVKRYTMRFSFGISYKAKDFSGLGLKPSTQDAPSATAKPATDPAVTPKK